VSDPVAGPGSPDERRNAIGWPRAIGSGLAILLIGVGVGVYGAQFAVEKLTGLDRDQRVWVATAVMTVAVIAMAWALRRLQARGLI
jgi:Ca2+/Na+ antiporter